MTQESQATESAIEMKLLAPNYAIAIYRKAGEKVGELDFNGPAMKFTGNAEESAKVFLEYVATLFAARLVLHRLKAKS
jgi:hypothetical protein